MYIPTSPKEIQQRNWSQLDIIFVSGDAYIDHPAFGVPLLARWLEAHGLKVGIICQPDWRSKEPFMILGRPRLCFAVSAGAMDSMVAHYTPARKLRHDDAYTPGGRHGARPNRATIIYTSRLKEAYKDVPVLIGGIEASLRRFAHYDFWEDKVRRSLLLDAKADMLIYGMAETSLLEVVTRLSAGEAIHDIRDVRGTCRCTVKGEASDCEGWRQLPSFEEVSSDRFTFAAAFRSIMHEQNPFSATTVVQRHGERQLLVYPPALPLTTAEMDAIYRLPFTRLPHPSYQESIPAWEQIKTSITSHRGCFGGCAFCAITMHQGKTIQSRSQQSIVAEIKALANSTWFRGSISDIGGPTANMYRLSCRDSVAQARCQRESCLYPRRCKNLMSDDSPAVKLLQECRTIKGVKHIAISSGVRYDLMEQQPGYFRELVAHHVSGLLKIAPEHLADKVTALMRKPGKESFETFLRRFRDESIRVGKRQSIVPYLISGHPGCTLESMLELALALKRLGLQVEQVQDFTPTPGTLSTCMYYTGIDPESGEKLYVPYSDKEKGLQKSLLLWHQPQEHAKIREAFKILGRTEQVGQFLGTGHKKTR